MQMNSEVVTRLESLPTPSTHKELRRFIRLCQGLFSFVPISAGPLTPLQQLHAAETKMLALTTFLTVWIPLRAAFSKALWSVEFFIPDSTSSMVLYPDLFKLAHRDMLVQLCSGQRRRVMALWSVFNANGYCSTSASSLACFLRCV